MGAEVWVVRKCVQTQGRTLDRDQQASLTRSSHSVIQLSSMQLCARVALQSVDNVSNV